MARFKAEGRSPSPTGRADRAQRAREAQAPLIAAARRHRLRAADRLREHRQPAARARRRAVRRDGRPALDRRRAGRSSSRSCSTEVAACSPPSAGSPSLLVARWTLGLIASAACRPRPRTRSRSTLDLPGAALRRPRSRSAPASCSGCSRRCTARGPTCCRRSRARAGQPSGARAAARFRTVAGDRADRALDGAARLGGPVHEEPVQRQPRRPRPRRRQRRHLRRLAGAERLHAGAVAAAVRAARGRAGGAAGRHAA